MRVLRRSNGILFDRNHEASQRVENEIFKKGERAISYVVDVTVEN